MRVGEVPNTSEPLPVSSVTADAKLADVGVARKVATPVPRPEIPVETGSPVALVNVAALGVPKFGVVNVGEPANTMLPLPVVVFPSTVTVPDVAGKTMDVVPSAPVAGVSVIVPDVAFFSASVPTEVPATPSVTVLVPLKVKPAAPAKEPAALYCTCVLLPPGEPPPPPPPVTTVQDFPVQVTVPLENTSVVTPVTRGLPSISVTVSGADDWPKADKAKPAHKRNARKIFFISVFVLKGWWLISSDRNEQWVWLMSHRR